MIGVFICKCGGNISRTVDVNEVKKAAGQIEDVSVARVTEFLCSKPGLDMIRDAIKKKGIKRVVVASCSPHMHEETFRNVISEEGLNRYLFEHVNLREHCSWIHDKDATEKAVDLVTAGISRARALKPLEKPEVDVKRDVLVIGGGISGITSALQLAEGKHRVYIVERNPSIGGRMAQLSKTFPTLDCSPCILSPRMADIEINTNITPITNSEIKEVNGGPGNFIVKVDVKPRGVDIDKCLKCGRCEKVCPVEVPKEFEEGLYSRKAIYMPFPQAIPSAYFIDFETCTKCGSCVEECPIDAVNLEEENEEITLEVGSIIVATGFDLISLEKLQNYRPDHPSSITALQMERMIENELTEGKVLKRSDGKRVKNIAYILCAGSRNPHNGVAYCCNVGCPYAIKQSILLKKFLPYLDIWIYYTDIRMSGRGFEEFYGVARQQGVKFIHGRPGGAIPTTDGRMEILVEDIDSGILIRNQVDILVLCSAMIASKGTKELADKLGIALGEDGFIASKHPKLNPISTLKEGIYGAGVSIGPKDIHDSVIDARAAAAHVMTFIGDGKRFLDPIKPILVDDCDSSGVCKEVCPYNAIELVEGKPVIDLFSCTGCGACVAACPRKALELPHYTTKQLEEEIKGLLSRDQQKPIVIGFFDDKISYTAADDAGTARLHYPTNMRIVRVPSAAILSRELLLKTLAYGADGVMIWEYESSKEIELAKKLVEKVQGDLEKKGIEKERVQLQPMQLPIFRVLPEFITKYIKNIEKIGKIEADQRKLLEK